jgi:hypothetical protein
MEINCWDGIDLNSEKRVGSGRVGSGRVALGRDQSGRFASVGSSPFIHLLSPKCESGLGARCFFRLFLSRFLLFWIWFPSTFNFSRVRLSFCVLGTREGSRPISRERKEERSSDRVLSDCDFSCSLRDS